MVDLRLKAFQCMYWNLSRLWRVWGMGYVVEAEADTARKKTGGWAVRGWKVTTDTLASE
jgi:hypothetical protein